MNTLRQHQSFFGIPAEEFSHRQGTLAYEFSKKTQPWIEEHIGKFGEDWFVELDREADSLRLSFKDDETEVYFKLSWMQFEHDDD
jgi:hypothetical protein